MASSTAYLLLRVRARDAVRCSLAGVPRLQLSHGPGEPTISVREARDESTYQAGPVLVTTRRAAVLKLAWSGHGCTTQPVHNGELQVSLGDGLGTLQTSGFGRMSACRARSGSGLDAVTERPFEPQTWRRGYSRSPLAEVDPGDSLGRVAARPGSTTRFTVTLTAPHDIPLDPCPDYVIGLAGQGVHAQARHALNCGAVPYRDAQGRPLLPGGTPLRFAMQVEAPQHDVPKLTWWLVEPSGRVGVTGRLVVGGPGAP